MVPLLDTREAELDGRVGYRSAIEHLAADGLIDRNRVGIIGFSRAGLYVLDTILHSPDGFAAATLAEFTDGSFSEYLANADYLSPARAEEFVTMVGVSPFGAGLREWIDKSAEFNSDKVDIPILFEVNSPVALLYINNWNLYAALRLQSKPVELLYMRHGAHVLNKPREIFVSEETNVDWYDFWLNGHEDGEPTKSEQYVRWEKLCDMQKQQNPEKSTFCVGTTH